PPAFAARACPPQRAARRRELGRGPWCQSERQGRSRMARDGLRSHLSGSVPVSIAAHLVVLLLLCIVPLASPALLPSVLSSPPGFGIAGSIGPPTPVLPSEPPRPPGPVRAAELPVSPRKIVDARPVYPEIARSARVEGTVVLEAVLDTTGRVTQLRVIKSVPM